MQNVWYDSLSEGKKSLCLRIEQVEHIDLATYAILQGRHAAIVAPTGSGKGCEESALVARLLSLERKIVVCSPRLDINSSIRSNFSTYDRVVFGPDSIELFPDMAREVNTDRLREYLHRSKSSNERWAPIVCHQTMVRMGDFLPLDCSGIVLIIDECHHMGAKAQKKFLDEFTRRGGLTVGFTATPYRTDGVSVILPNSVVAHLSVVDHMRSGNAPSRAMSEIVACRTSTKITEKAFLGEKVVDEQAASIAKEMVKKWLRDGRPKVITYYPSGSSVSANRNLREAIIREFRSIGARVLDATGDQEHELNLILSQERARSHADSEYDIIIGSVRVQEGFDWHHCSSIYCVGMPKSTGLMVQLFGRTFRLKERPIGGKINPYSPEGYADISEISFFIPSSDQGDDLKHLAKVHSWNTLALCTFLADHETGQRYVVMKAIRDGVRSARSLKKILPISQESRKEEIFETESDIAKVCLDLETLTVESVDRNNRMFAEFQILETKSPGLVTNQVLSDTLASKGFTSEEVETFLATKLVDSNPAACGKFQDRIKANTVRGLSVEDSVLDAFKNVLLQFRDETVDKVLLESVGRHVISVTGEKMIDFSERLRCSRFASFSEARKICIEAGILSMKDYLIFRDNNHDLYLPSCPDKSYPEWICWSHFLGKFHGIISFSEAQRICVEAGVNSSIKYKIFRKNNPNLCLPAAPDDYYGDEWVSWPHFLCTIYPSFSEAQRICVEAEIKSVKSYSSFRKDNPQCNLLSHPDKFYPEWISWPHFFRRTDVITFSEAQAICIKAEVKSRNQYKIFRGKNLNTRLPANPGKCYKEKWVSWSHFLCVSLNKIVSFSEAQAICIKAGVKSYAEYKFFRKNNPQHNLPSALPTYYEKEYVSLHHFLGMPHDEIISFSEAQSICVKAGVKSSRYYAIFRNKNRDLRLPASPDEYYGDEWISWDHFLGRVPS